MEVPLKELGESELDKLVRGWRREAGSWFQSCGGHTGGASGAVHQGPWPLGAHQREDQIAIFWKINFFCFSRCQSQWVLQRDRFLNWS